MFDTSKRSAWMKFIQDKIGPQKQWPIKIKAAMYGKKVLKNTDRFTITVFLLCNGLDPFWIKRFFDTQTPMDDSAKRQVNWIIEKYPTSRWTAWNVAMNRSM